MSLLSKIFCKKKVDDIVDLANFCLHMLAGVGQHQVHLRRGAGNRRRSEVPGDTDYTYRGSVTYHDVFFFIYYGIIFFLGGGVDVYLLVNL